MLKPKSSSTVQDLPYLQLAGGARKIAYYPGNETEGAILLCRRP
jgi:hypothetical protein